MLDAQYCSAIPIRRTDEQTCLRCHCVHMTDHGKPFLHLTARLLVLPHQPTAAHCNYTPRKMTLRRYEAVPELQRILQGCG